MGVFDSPFGAEGAAVLTTEHTEAAFGGTRKKRREELVGEGLDRDSSLQGLPQGETRLIFVACVLLDCLLLLQSLLSQLQGRPIEGIE